jgi:hypothetical protein
MVVYVRFDQGACLVDDYPTRVAFLPTQVFPFDHRILKSVFG